MDKKAKAGQEAFRKTSNVYDDGNIPQSDLPLPDDKEGTSDVVPDEVPRKDGPGGENSSKNRAE